MELQEFVEMLQKWHKHKVDQLQLVVAQEDATITISGFDLPPDSDKAKGFRSGVGVALQLLGTLPFTVKVNDDDDDDDE